MMHSDVTVRDFQPVDLPQVLDIAVAAWAPIYASYREMLGEEIFTLAFPDWQEVKRQQVRDGCAGARGATALVAVIDELPVGFATFYCNAATRVGEIGNNAVLPTRRGKGIAGEMYRVVLERMRQAGMRVALVSTGGDVSHAPARRAYEKAGFGASVPRRDYFRLL
jgi:GNAT superfamily N-acetyltransferase